MQALVGTDEVETVDPTMLIPVSILWWQKCCYLLLWPCQVPPWLSVWLHKLKLYLHYLVRNFYSCTFGIDQLCLALEGRRMYVVFFKSHIRSFSLNFFNRLWTTFCGGFWLTFFCVTVVLLCVMTCVFFQVIN